MTTLSGQVSQSSDDSRQTGTGGTATLTDALVNITLKSGANQGVVAFRFQNVTIPQGATITAATLSPNFASGTNTGSCNIDCEAHDNASVFLNAAGDLGTTTRPRTGSPVSFNTATIGSTGFHASPDISTPIQNVINRAGWASGNSLVVIIDSLGTTGQQCNVNTFDQNSADGAELSITYTAPGGGGGGNNQNLLLLGVG